MDRNVGISYSAFIFILWMPGILLRPSSESKVTVLQDVAILAAFLSWSSRSAIFAWLVECRFVLLTFAASSILTFLSATAFALNRSVLPKTPTKWEEVDSEQPLILKCRTTHARYAPKQHSFEYPYLQVSIPVHCELKSTWLFKVGWPSHWSLFSVNPRDYLFKSSSRATLKKRLTEYLEEQGVSSVEWSRAYLITAPRFLGYSFNPVSFWYIYDETDKLTMMVLEVNNTFEERRMYLSKFDGSTSKRLRQEWSKDFHVSPFNSRKGSYSFSTTSPYHNGLYTNPGIDNTIVLCSSKNLTKLVTRLFSNGKPLPFDTIGYRDILLFVLQWGWLGLFTYPRILKEAFLLFTYHFLHVWLRPEVYASSISRLPSQDETFLEQVFVNYVKSLTKLQESVTITFSSPTISSKIFRNGTEINKTSDTRAEFSIQVLTPAFYKQWLRYDNLVEAIRAESMLADERHRTIGISDEGLLTSLSKAEQQISRVNVPIYNFKWYLSGILRRICHQKTGPVDSYEYLQQASDSSRYRKLMTKELLAVGLFGKQRGIVEVLEGIIRVMTIYFAVYIDVFSSSLVYIVLSLYGAHFWAMIKG